MATQIWINFGSGNGLLPDGTKPLPEPLLTYHQVFCGIHMREFSPEMFNLIHNMCLEITFSKLLPHLPEANELTGQRIEENMTPVQCPV